MRFRPARDDCDRRPVPDRLPNLVAVDRRDTSRFALRPERARVLRCLATDFLRGRPREPFGLFMRLRGPRSVAGAIGRRFSAAFPAIAPTTPPTTAPIGPAMLPAVAPATAPAVCFGMGGILMFLDEVSSFSAFGFLGITVELLNSSFPGLIHFERRRGFCREDLGVHWRAYPNDEQLNSARNQLQVR